MGADLQTLGKVSLRVYVGDVTTAAAFYGGLGFHAEASSDSPEGQVFVSRGELSVRIVPATAREPDGTIHIVVPVYSAGELRREFLERGVGVAWSRNSGDRDIGLDFAVRDPCGTILCFEGWS